MRSGNAMIKYYLFAKWYISVFNNLEDLEWYVSRMTKPDLLFVIDSRFRVMQIYNIITPIYCEIWQNGKMIKQKGKMSQSVGSSD
jgi:hypothetical protein